MTYHSFDLYVSILVQTSLKGLQVKPFLVMKNIRIYIYDETVGSALKHQCVV